MAIGLIVNRETQSLLLGESAVPEVVSTIERAVATTPGIEQVIDLRTIHVGPDDLVVAAGIMVDATMNAERIAATIIEAETRVRAAVAFRTVVYLEPRPSKKG